MCSICGQPGFVRCNCTSAQPFCDQCDQNSVCVEQMDSQCVIYHFTSPGYTPPVTRLINMGLPNGSSAETIFEKIDTLFGAAFFRPWTIGNTSSLELELDGPGLPVTLKGNVIVSPNVGNSLSTLTNGLFVPTFVETGKVRVSAVDPQKYLEDAVVGGTDGCVSLDITRDPISGLLFFQPTISADCLFTNLFITEDTNSIHLNLNTAGTPVILQASSKISADVGNTISVHGDGLFVPTPVTPPAGLTAANNGLSVFGGNTVQLGGTLIKNTTIDFGAAFNLSFTDNPLLVIGDTPSSSIANFQVFNSYTTAPTVRTTAAVFQTTGTFANTDFQGAISNLIIVGGAQTHTSTGVNCGLYGQLLLNNSGDITFGTGLETGYTGIAGIVFKENSGNVLAGNIMSAGYFQSFASDTGNVADWTALRTGGVFAAPTGAPYTGTVTNYYSLYMQDVGASTYAARLTNKFAIYQVGTGDISRFFGPVQNAGGTTQFTSDARVKENINPFTRGLKEIDLIDTHIFNYTYNKDKVITGIVAQELEQIIPEAVDKGNFSTPDGTDFNDFRMVDQNVLFYTMLNAIKELSSQNKALNDRIFALESKNITFGK